MGRIWQFYKKSVGEYFINRLNALSEQIESESGTPGARQAYSEFEQVLERYLGNIRGTLGKTSDIFTEKGPTGKKTQFVDPQLAQLTGIYKSPKQLEEFIKRTSGLAGQFEPILDVLVGDLDPASIDAMLSPLDKVQAAFNLLTQADPAMKEVLDDADLFRRIGEQAIDAWDFDMLTKGITQLRAALQSYNQLQLGGFGGMGEDFTEQARKNVEETIKLFKKLETQFSQGGRGASPLGITGVPTFLDPQTQSLLHKRNIAQVRERFRRPEKEGGFPRGRAFTLRQRVVDPASKQILENIAVNFRKVGDAATSTGKSVGVFTEDWDDMVKAVQARKGLGQAFGRVIRWGIASRAVYGVVGAMQDMVNTMTDVESGIAILRQVMSPLETNFEEIQNAAANFAKGFGLPIRGVIDSMRVFAQQGLAQQDVIDRTRTSVLAANVSTLSAAEATEAITAAAKIYRNEGESTIRFIDSWSEVEAKHAITSKDLALALQKSAAVAKTSGVTFDQLNGIITGIGETSRQTGKEIGTSLRFIFRRIQSAKGPKELGKIGIPTVAPTGDLRSSFEILKDLAGVWDDLTNAQRLNIAQAIGGRRHYNNLIILMNHWDDALSALSDSLNSKGAA